MSGGTAPAGIRLHAAGESGPAVLWVHGYTLDGTIFAPLWRRLPGYRHLAPDLPGHGASTAFSSADALEEMIDAVDRTARALGARRLVGLSFGGTVALEAALRAPERYDALVLASPGLLGGPVDPESATCHLELLELARSRGLGPWLAERWLSVPPAIFAGARRHPRLFARLEAIVRRHRFEELLAERMAALATSVRDPRDLRRIRSRVALLVGEDDMPAFKRTAELLRRELPDARRLYVAEAGHLSLLEAPETVAATLASILGEDEHASASRAEAPAGRSTGEPCAGRPSGPHASG